MAVFSTIIAAVGVAASIAGTVVAYQGAQKQAKAQKQALAAQQRAENIREQQMEVDATRKRRQMIREQQVARAQALQTSVNQGADSSSVLGGVYGGIGGQTGVNVLGVEQNREMGRGIFSANRDATAANIRGAAGASQAAMGNAISSLGGALVSNSGTIGRIGTYMFSPRTA